MTDYSIYSPHTGGQVRFQQMRLFPTKGLTVLHEFLRIVFQTYEPGVVPIPTGAVTVEDAELMQRLQDRGMHVRRLLLNHACMDSGSDGVT